jgi:hypothetical protein
MSKVEALQQFVGLGKEIQTNIVLEAARTVTWSELAKFINPKIPIAEGFSRELAGHVAQAVCSVSPRSEDYIASQPFLVEIARIVQNGDQTS